jgi:hypothetical protein
VKHEKSILPHPKLSEFFGPDYQQAQTIGRGFPPRGMASYKEQYSQSAVVESTSSAISSGFEISKEKGSSILALLSNPFAKMKKDTSPPSTARPPSASSPSNSKESSIYDFLPRFALPKKNTGRDPATPRFPQGCSSSYYSCFLLPGESLIGKSSPASLPSYYFDFFNPDLSSSLVDGQLLCTNYRLLFVPAEREKEVGSTPLQKLVSPSQTVPFSSNKIPHSLLKF